MHSTATKHRTNTYIQILIDPKHLIQAIEHRINTRFNLSVFLPFFVTLIWLILYT